MSRFVALLLLAFFAASPLLGGHNWPGGCGDCPDGSEGGPACADCLCCPHQLPAAAGEIAPRPVPTLVAGLEPSPVTLPIAPEPREILHVPLPRPA